LEKVSKKKVAKLVVLLKRSTDVSFPKKVVKFFVAVNMPPPPVSKYATGITSLTSLLSPRTNLHEKKWPVLSTDAKLYEAGVKYETRML
jgi:hypothetical protein